MYDMTTLETLERRTAPLIPRLSEKVLPEGYELLPGLNSVYELELALVESARLSKDELQQRSAYFARVNGRETNHFKLCSGPPLQVGKGSARLRAFFEVYKFKTSYATHGLFPYRGKFHPQLIKAMMNVIGVGKGDLVLDPMTGSGTTSVEASLIGINSIGYDMNPFAVFMSRAKLQGLSLTQEELDALREDGESEFEGLSLRGVQQTLGEISEIQTSKVHPILLLAYLDALGYSKRVKTKKFPELLPIVLARYVAAIGNFISIRDQLGLKLGHAQVEQRDARDLDKIRSDSVDAVITSPPYSFAIDYLKGDRLQLEFLGYDLSALRDNMIGLRGSGLKNQVFAYLDDTEKFLTEMGRVLKSGKFAVIIIGSNSVQLSKVEEATGLRLEDEIVKLGSKHGLALAQRFERPIEGVQNVMKSEHILFLEKQ
jgi:SAM-dependent methyltransferase